MSNKEVETPFTIYIKDADLNDLIVNMGKFGPGEAVERGHPSMIDYILIGIDDVGNEIYYNEETEEMFVEFVYYTN